MNCVVKPVSYTHLDVYKRQLIHKSLISIANKVCVRLEGACFIISSDVSRVLCFNNLICWLVRSSSSGSRLLRNILKSSFAHSGGKGVKWQIFYNTHTYIYTYSFIQKPLMIQIYSVKRASG